MLYRVFGPAGSGKTQHLYSVLAETFRRGEPCVWITPEPQSFQTEREILKRLGNESSGLVEVMTFGEMPDRVARVYGGASVNYLDRGAVIALLSVLASRHREDLREYAASAEDPGFLTGLLQLFKRLRSAMITPDRLEEAVSGGNWDGRSRLKGKLKDVSVLFRAYDAFFDERTQDARNRLTHLAARLPSCPYFKGKTVFLDGFYRFQEQELAVLKGILSQAKAVWCGFSGEGEEDARTGKERDVFSGIRQTADKLSRLAGETRDVRMPGYVRSLDPALAFLEKNLWADGRDTFEGNADRIRLIRAGNAFDESNAVASGIMELVRNGKRFRDIAVFVRNPQAYAGVLDAVFRASGIPYFFSGKEDIMTNPLIAFVCSSLEMLSTRFSLSSVRKYLKTGYTGLTMDESDLLLRYAESWSIHGSAWTSEKPWTRNPDGYRSGPMTEEQQSTLDAVNEARTFFRCSMTEPLSRLPSWNGEYPADDILETVYRHLEDCGAATHFVDRVNRMLEAKEEENARRESQIWEILVTILDRLHDICGRERMTIARLLTLFRLTAEQYDVSTIPSGADCVTVGDPASMRPDDAKAVFLMGCNEGVFPASCGQDGLFDEGETARLCELDLPVSDPMDARMTAERFYFYSAATTPSEMLFLSYPSGTVAGDPLRPSFGMSRVQEMFPSAETAVWEASAEGQLYSAEAAAHAFPLLPEGRMKEEVREILASRGIPVRSRAGDLFEPNVRITVDDPSVRLSPSSLERYRGCPFSYFGTDLLRLKEKTRFRFARAEMGTLLHAVLEEYLRSHVREGKFHPPASQEAMEAETDALFFRLLGEAGSDSGGQFLHTCRNYRKIVQAAVADLTEEFKAGGFLPKGFEVPVGRGPEGLPPLSLRTEDGRQVLMTGVIDRVDACERNGETYIRVADYKSYKQTVDLGLSEAYGLREQMLLYLMACCRPGTEGGKKPLPAGVVYDELRLEPAELDGTETAEERLRKEAQAFAMGRSGLLLDDEGILLEMDPGRDGRFLPNVYKKGEIDHGSKHLMTAEGFQNLFRGLENRLRETGGEILGGRMDIDPVRIGSHDACAYCTMKYACRRGSENGNGRSGSAETGGEED